jgi:hypothetical protein
MTHFHYDMETIIDGFDDVTLPSVSTLDLDVILMVISHYWKHIL